MISILIHFYDLKLNVQILWGSFINKCRYFCQMSDLYISQFFILVRLKSSGHVYFLLSFEILHGFIVYNCIC